MKKKFSSLNLFILIFFIVSVFYPLVIMLAEVEWQNFSSLVTSDAFKESLFNSLFVTSISTLISIGLAYVLAICLNRTNIKRKRY